MQDLHGQDAPYPAGGGKNKLKNNLTTGTNKGITFTLNSDGTVSVFGTNDGTSYSSKQINTAFQTENGVSYTMSGGVNSDVFIRNVTAGVSATDSSVTFTGDGNTHHIEIRVSKDYAITGTVTIKPMICLSSATDPSTFAPYSNICPISGWTGCNVSRTGKNLISNHYHKKLSYYSMLNTI